SVAYHLVLRYWLLLGGSEAVVRSFSVIVALATIVALYKLGRELFDGPTAVLAAVFAASNPFLVRYSQEVCAYTPAALLAVLASLYLLRALKKDSGGNWAGYAVSAILMLYCHVLTVLVVVAHGLAAALARERRLTTRMILAFLAIAAAFIPLAWCIIAVPPHPRVWLTSPGIHELEGTLADFVGPLGYLFLLFAMVSIGYSAREKMTVESRGWRYMFLLSWALLPPVLLFVLSQWKPLFLSRYLVPSVPPLLLLVAALVRQLKPRRLAILCGVLIVAFSVRSSVIYLRQRSDPRESYDWRDATSYMVQQVQPGDAVVFYYHHERFPFQYYRERLAPEGIAAQVFPQGSNEEVLEEAFPIENRNHPSFAAASYRRIWLVYSDALAATEYAPYQDLMAFRRQLTEKFQASTERHFGYIHLTLFAGPVPHQ
ncbi:MAG TPA: glycosyltransferase family 39 protein, partial [Terriglobales bacterium]|nr:glycosyltransferase family 39 protein [Terriglobales bacterium]